jgi:hypothetical protein
MPKKRQRKNFIHDPEPREITGYLTPDERRLAEVIEIGNIARIPPNVGIFDEPTYCFKVNHQWWRIISGVVEWLTQVQAWREAEDERYIGIQEVMRFLEGVVCEMPYQLRQNPENDCQLEYSTDEGET